MFKEFKEFAMKGNVLDMAIGIVIGGAFGTIVKSLVELQGGEVQVQSQLGKGTTFTFTMPVAAPALALPQAGERGRGLQLEQPGLLSAGELEGHHQPGQRRPQFVGDIASQLGLAVQRRFECARHLVEVVREQSNLVTPVERRTRHARIEPPFGNRLCGMAQLPHRPRYCPGKQPGDQRARDEREYDQASEATIGQPVTHDPPRRQHENRIDPAVPANQLGERPGRAQVAIRSPRISGTDGTIHASILFCNSVEGGPYCGLEDPKPPG